MTIAPDLSFVNGRMKGVQSPVGQHKLLLSPYPLTLDDVYEQFTFSPQRRRLFDGLSRYVAATRELPSPPLLQVISGSFVDDVEEPRDIDLANIVDRVDDEAMPLLFDSVFTKTTFGIDSMTICLSENGHSNALALLRLSSYYASRRDGLHRAYVWLR